MSQHAPPDTLVIPLVMLLAACSSPFSCDPDYYPIEEPPDLAKRTCFAGDPGDSCTHDDQCCSKSCGFRRGVEQTSCCLPVGMVCRPSLFENLCCTGICSNGTCNGCLGPGKSCVAFTDCCSGACDRGECTCSTTSCGIGSDCCSGVCDRHRCVPLDLSVPIDFSRPIDLGGVG